MRISGDGSVGGQFQQTPDGRLMCRFPERIVLIANHQVRFLADLKHVRRLTLRRISLAVLGLALSLVDCLYKQHARTTLYHP